MAATAPAWGAEMKTIVVNEVIRDQLLAAGKEALIQDPTGRIIGRFLAETSDAPDDIDWPSDEELDRRLRESPRFSPAQVMERLRSLRKSQ
jgi:hypothetical protein